MSTERSIAALERELRASAGRATEEAAAASAARFPERAAAEGALDVAYASTDSPVGPLLLAATSRGLVRVAFATESSDDVLEQLAGELSPRVLEAPAELDRARRELDEYFSGARRSFELPLDRRLSRGFRLEALRTLSLVPYGETVTYSELARQAGRPRAQRAAGSACGSNPIPIVVPCHRVVRAGGTIGSYRGGPDTKRFLLGLEGSLEQLDGAAPARPSRRA